MPLLNRRQFTWTVLLIGLPTHFPISGLAEWPTPPPTANYSPPMATLIVVIVGLFLTVGLVSIFFRHFAMCFGYGPNHPATTTGRAWRTDEARGLHASIVESFPTFPYSDVKLHRLGKGTLECAVCLTEFSGDDVLQMLPVCNHVFHLDCITPWLASHVTCPVCRANLEFQHNFDHSTVRLSDEESQPSDQINRDVVLSVGPSPVHEIKDGEGHRVKLPRSHTTGHSLVDDCERFTLRLPEEVRTKLVTANHSILPAMISPRIGYRATSAVFTGSPIRPDRWRFSASPPFISRPGSTSSAGIMSGPRNLFKSIKSPLNRGRPRYSSDIGERSSDQLWPVRRPHDTDLDGQ